MGGILDISHKNIDARETGVFWVYVWPFWGSDGIPDGWEWEICQYQIYLRWVESKKWLVGLFLGWSI